MVSTTPNLPKLKFPWRMMLYGIAILYMAIDLYLVNGPLSRMIDRMRGEGVAEQISKVPTGLVATVDSWPITGADLERGIWEYCAVRGLSVDEVPERRLRVIERIVLSQLIDDLAVWRYARANPVEVDPAEVDEAIARLRGHFGSDEEFERRVAAQGMRMGEFREYVADQVHQRRWLEEKASKYITVSDAEVEAWFEAHRDEMVVPERWRARHVFLASGGRDRAEVGLRMAALADAVRTGEISFEQAVERDSEDLRSKPAGGDLGYFSERRMPADFIAGVRGAQPGVVVVFETRLGWHLVEVLDHRPQRPATPAEMRAEIRAHLEAEKRADVIPQIVADLRGRARIWPRDPQPRVIGDAEALWDPRERR